MRSPLRRAVWLGTFLAAAVPAAPIGPAYPAPGAEVEGWRICTRRDLGIYLGRMLARYGKDIVFAAAEAPRDVAADDLPAILKALTFGVLAAPGGRFRPGAEVTRLELALAVDRAANLCLGYPPRIAKRRFPWPRDLTRLPPPEAEAMERVLRLRLLRAEDKEFLPRQAVSRYEAMVALARMLEHMGTRDERPPVEFPDLPPHHYARHGVRVCYARGLIGPPLPGLGLTREDPGPHRLFGRDEPVTALSRTPFQVNPAPADLSASFFPASEELRALHGRVQEEEVELIRLKNKWDELRITGADAGLPRRDLQAEVARHRQRVGRLDLALARSIEDLERAPRTAAEPAARARLDPVAAGYRTEARQLYEAYTRLFDELRGAVPAAPPQGRPRPLPLAARGSAVGGLLEGAPLEGEAGALDAEILVVPGRAPEPAPLAGISLPELDADLIPRPPSSPAAAPSTGAAPGAGTAPGGAPVPPGPDDPELPELPELDP